MFLGFIIVVVLGNLVRGLNDSDFIESLPVDEKEKLLQKVGERIANEVKLVRRSNVTEVEMSEAQQNEFEDFVTKVLNEEKNNTIKYLEINGTNNNKDTDTSSTNNILNIVPLNKELPKTLKSKSDSKGDSKIITIPVKLLKSSIKFINPDINTPIEVTEENFSTETALLREDTSSAITEVTTTTPEIIVTSECDTPPTLTPASTIVQESRRSEELPTTTENNIITTTVQPNEPTVTTNEPTVTTNEPTIPTTIKENIITTTMKTIANDSLRVGNGTVHYSDSEVKIKLANENPNNPPKSSVDEAAIVLNMNTYEDQSTQKSEDIMLPESSVGKSGEEKYVIDNIQTTDKNDEYVDKIRRDTNTTQVSRRAGNHRNETITSGLNKHPWPQGLQNLSLENSHSLLDNKTKLNDTVNFSNHTNNRGSLNLDLSKKKVSLPHTRGAKLHLANNNTLKTPKHVHRQHPNILSSEDEKLTDTSWDDYPNADEQPISLSSGSPETEYYPRQTLKPINANIESFETNEELPKSSTSSLHNFNGNQYNLFESTTHTHTVTTTIDPVSKKVDVASTPFIIFDTTTQKPFPPDFQTIKLPILPNNIQTIEDSKKEPIENVLNSYKNITEVSSPLKKQNLSNKINVPPGLVESIKYPKNVKKKIKKKRKPLKLHISYGQNPVKIKITYGEKYKKPKQLKINIIKEKNNNNRRKHNYNSLWPRRNFGDNKMFVPDLFTSHGFEYTTLPSYLSYVPSLSHRPNYYKPDIPYTLFTNREKFKNNGDKNQNENAAVKQENSMSNTPEDKQFGNINIYKPAKVELYTGQFSTLRDNLAKQKIGNDISSLSSQDMKSKNRFQKVAIRNDKYPNKNPARCRFGKSARSKSGYEPDVSESDCRSSEENYDNSIPVKENQEYQEPTIIALIAVISKNKPKGQFGETIVSNVEGLLDPPTDIYKQQQEMFKNEDLPDGNDLQSLVMKKNKIKGDCPKPYAIDVYVESIGMLILNEDDSLRKFDWLGTTIDIQAAIQKLLLLSNKVTNHEKIHSADHELLKFVIYLWKLAEQKSEERENCRLNKKKNITVQQELDYKIMQKADWMINGRSNDPNMNKELYEYYNNQSSDYTEVVDFISFLNVLETELYDLHTVIKKIASVTKYKKQNWFNDIKTLYLDYANKQDLLGVLLHLSLTKIIDFIENCANNGLTYNYIQYVIDHQEEMLDVVDEFDFCSVLTTEMEKNIVIN